MNILIVLSLLELVFLTQEGGAEDLSKSVSFHCYTRKNLQAPTLLKIGDIGLLTQSKFDASKPTFVVVHGWRNKLSSDAIQQPKNALLARYDCNVIAVDWGNIASSILYPSVAGKVPAVGAHLAKLLEFMHTSGKLNFAKTHLIGHSLGAHVCGFAGKRLRGRGLFRITGMDPAGPSFPAADSTKRLAVTDANFVDCIYTNAGKLGFSNPICKANFYPNGGSKQPGCGFDLTGSCSHGRSYNLYSESVSPNLKFKALKCKGVPDAAGKGCVATNYLMGEPAPPTMEGIYYVKTRDKAPFPFNS